MAEPVLVISSDPYLGTSLEAVARGRIQVARLDPVRRPAAWPDEPAAAVVLDVAVRQREAAHSWIRQHHHGLLVVLLKPGERDPSLPPDPSRMIVRRPFRLADLVAVLERPPAPAAVQSSSARSPAPADLVPGPAPAPGAPGAIPRPTPRSMPAGGPGRPRPDWPTAATRLGGRRRRRRGRRVAARVLLALLAVLAVAGAWLAFGLLEAREDLRVGAAAVRSELAGAEAALARGEPAAAAAAVQAAARNLDFAQAVPERREMRVAARLPLLSSGVSDARHLLAAARSLTGAGERAVAVAASLQAGRSAAGGGRVDLAALGEAAGQAEGLAAALERTRNELAKVRGGPLAPGAGETKRWALGRLEAAVARVRPIVATLRALPAALGADRPRTYLVVLTGAAEGAAGPLALREVVLDGGVVEVRAAGGGLGEVPAAGPSLGLPGAGPALLGAYQAQGRPRPDGVVAVDPLAVGALLEATGPIQVPGYGRLEAATVARQLTQDAAVRWPDPAERRRRHEAVVGAVVARLLSGRDLLATGRVLAAAGAAGNLRAYATDPDLQRVLARHRLDGAS